MSTIERIESGQRRTRRSTLERIVLALDKPEALDHLVALAGPALAPESAYAERIASRRARRHRPTERTTPPGTAALLWELARRNHVPAEYAAYDRYGE